MRVTRRSPHLTRVSVSGLSEDRESFLPRLLNVWELPMKAWDHHCRLAGPIPSSAVTAIFARSEWAARLPLGWEWFPRVRYVWLNRAVVEIQSERDLHTLFVHAPHEAYLSEAIRSFAGTLHEARPQAVWCGSEMEPHDTRLGFTPMASDAPLAKTRDELITWLGDAGVRWFDLLGRRPGDPRVVLVSSDDFAAPRRFIHELADGKRATHAVFVYGVTLRALMRKRRIDIGFQKLRLIDQAGGRRVIVVIDNAVEWLGADDRERQKVLSLMGAWAHGLGSVTSQPLVIGLLPKTTAARASALWPQRWHPCVGWHLPSHPSGAVMNETVDF